jgi:hypothetical protein
MGNTTIIELNHDRVDEIFHNEATQSIFLNQIKTQLSTFEYSGSEILGGKVLAGFHKSSVINDKWTRFKKRMRW